MSTGILLVLVGIILQVIDIPIDFGPITINLTSDIVAYILIIIGIKPFLKQPNLLWKKGFKKGIILLIISIIERLSTTLDFGDSNATISYLFMAVTSVIFMFFVYDYLESVALEAKMAKIEIALEPMRTAFSGFCVMLIVYYLAVTLFNIPIVNIVANVILVITAFYYCITINNVRTVLYPSDKKNIFTAD